MGTQKDRRMQRSFVPQGMLLVALLLGSMMGAEAIQAFHEEQQPDCAEAVQKATAECESERKDAAAGLKDVCGSVTYSTTMTTVTRLKQMASHQTVVIKTATTALESAKSAAASMAKKSGSERSSMLTLVSKQKHSKTTLHNLKQEAHKVASEMRDLKVKADRATEAAVELARRTSDAGKVSEAKRKAHDLYQQYVDYEVKMATAQRKVHVAKTELSKITTLVETEITKAKATAEHEAIALKKVATEKMNVAMAQQKQADFEVEANQNAEAAAIEAEHVLKKREDAAANDISDTKSTLNKAKTAEKKAAETVRKVAREGPKAKDTTLNIRKLEKKAEAISKGEAAEDSFSSTSEHKGVNIRRDTNDHQSNVHITIDKSAMRKKSRISKSSLHDETKKKRSIRVHTYGADKDVHEQYAAKVKALEKQRLEAADNKAAAVKELRRLEGSNASSDKINGAKLDVKTAQATVDRLVEQQNAAVAEVVNHIENTDTTKDTKKDSNKDTKKDSKPDKENQASGDDEGAEAPVPSDEESEEEVPSSDEESE